MEEWSILSSVVSYSYIQYNRHPKNFHNINIRAVSKEKYKRKSNIESEERQMLELDFGDRPENLKEEYPDVYKRIQSEILNIKRFDENLDLSTTYLERVDTTKTSKFKDKYPFLISEHGYTMGKLLNGTECQILLDTRASKSFMSKTLHSLSKFTSRMQRIQAENGQFIISLFIIPEKIDIHRHMFEIYT